LNDTVITLVSSGRYSHILGCIVIGGGVGIVLLWHPIWYRSDSSRRHPW